jgi:tetratricopeptide (TPR) repeat protein
LEESRVRGYSSGRAAEADLLLGKLYFDTEQFPRSMPPLTEALAGLPEQASPINRLLADACLRSADPDWQNAQRHLSALLKDTELATEPRAQAELDLARAYFELGELTRCEAVLSKMNKNTEVYSEAAMLRGRVFMGEADAILLEDLFATTVPDAARDKYVQAAVIFDELLEGVVGTRSNDLIRQARYLRAICRMKQGLNAEAETELANIRRGNFSTPEGLASALAIAELQQSQGRDQDAAAMFRSVISQAVAMSPYENQWMSLTQFLERLEGAYRKFLDAKQFDHALVIAKGMVPLVLSKQTVELSAIAERGWAQQLELEVADAALADRPQIMSRAQTAWMRAGRLYEQLARLRYSERLFPQDVWNSAECYFNGHEYQRTTKLLMLYLENEARSNHPPALTLLGKAHLALGNPIEALKWLGQCIKFFPKNPHSYRARIVAAKANQELGRLVASGELLTENLEHEGLTPSSVEWRESKFELGRVFYHQGVKHEAKSRLKGVKDPNATRRKEGLVELEMARDAFQLSILQLEEAVRRDELAKRDPLSSETLEARYFIAEAHRQSAKFARRKLLTVTIETTRVSLSREMKRELNAAAETYSALNLMLNRKLEQSELTEIELRLLRNCYSARADAMYDLGKYAEARKAYSTATNRYQHEPESLEAYVQIANCYRQENRSDDARGTLELAKVVLERIRPDADFNKTTRYSRDEWIVLLDWLTAL